MRLRKTRKAALAIGAAAVAVAVIGFLLIYFVVFPTSSPKPYSLASSATVTVQSSNSSLAGRWVIASGSQAGYRVREQLAFLPAESDAVGRTSQIAGAATVSDTRQRATISAARFTVAVDTLKSDRSMRDEKIHTIGLESNTYPTATFTLSRPITISSSALSGRVARVSATGVLTLHGASRQVTIPLELTLSGQTLEAAGALTFPWGEFNMTAPSIGGFVTVTDKATMEFDLRLTRA